MDVTNLKRGAGLSGEVAYLFAYDLAYDMKREPVTRLLGESIKPFDAGPSRPSPRSFGFYRPQTVKLPPRRCDAAGRSELPGVDVRRTVKLFPVGAVSVVYRINFEVAALEDLMAWHRMTLDGQPIEASADALAAQVLAELSPHLIRPHRELASAESYTIFCIERGCLSIDEAAPQCATAAAWLEAHRRPIARLLTEETGRSRLSEQEVQQATATHLSYYEQDLVVIDWDAALIVDEPQNFDEILHVMELANVQLEELAAYDRMLDWAMERSYRDVAKPPRGGMDREFTRHLRELRIDLARFSDELSNITKFFGDWHLARLYQAAANKFHLGDWDRTVEQKLQTLAEFYQLLKQDQMNRYMLYLEAAIVVLFIIDLVAIFASA